MANAFRLLSSIIEVDFPWCDPNRKVLRHPSAHEPVNSRIVFHETVHYWQQIGLGFMAKMAEEDWQRLQRFEHDAKLTGPGPYRTEFVNRHPVCDFSVHDLLESLARFWDVHVIGPHRLLEMDFADPKRSVDEFLKEQYFAFKEKGMIVHPEHGGYSDLAFDMAMQASAGNYARPYLYVRERYNSVVTGTLFPLVGYFALQTKQPVEAFLKGIEAVAPHLEQVPGGQAIESLWKFSYALTRNQMLKIAHTLEIGDLMITGALIKNGPLWDHPVYQWIFLELDRGRKLLEDTAFATELGQTFGGVPKGLLGIIATDFCLAAPGDTMNRSFLVEWLAPPCVAFADGKRWLLTELYRRELVPDVDDMERELSAERERVAQSCVEVQQRWGDFRRASRGY